MTSIRAYKGGLKMIKKPSIKVKKPAKKTASKQGQKKCKTLVKIKGKGVQTNKKIPTKFYLTDLSKCRAALNKMLNFLHNDLSANIPKIRAEAYIVNSIITVFQIEKEYELEQRLQDLESQLKGGGLSIANGQEALLK